MSENTNENKNLLNLVPLNYFINKTGNVGKKLHPILNITLTNGSSLKFKIPCPSSYLCAATKKKQFSNICDVNLKNVIFS